VQVHMEVELMDRVRSHRAAHPLPGQRR